MRKLQDGFLRYCMLWMLLLFNNCLARMIATVCFLILFWIIQGSLNKVMNNNNGNQHILKIRKITPMKVAQYPKCCNNFSCWKGKSGFILDCSKNDCWLVCQSGQYCCKSNDPMLCSERRYWQKGWPLQSPRLLFDVKSYYKRRLQILWTPMTNILKTVKRILTWVRWSGMTVGWISLIAYYQSPRWKLRWGFTWILWKNEFLFFLKIATLTI